MFALSETARLIRVSFFTTRRLVESVYGDTRLGLTWSHVMELMQLARFLPLGYTTRQVGEWYDWMVLQRGTHPLLSRDATETLIETFVQEKDAQILARDALTSLWSACTFDGDTLVRYTPYGWDEEIVLDRERREGMPTVARSYYRTSEVYDAYRRTHDLQSLADMWGLTLRAVCHAVRFQLWLAGA